jgi:hypothetical protein
MLELDLQHYRRFVVVLLSFCSLSLARAGYLQHEALSMGIAFYGAYHR